MLNAHTVIIGGGVIGASTAYHLAVRGCTDVILIEREAFFGQGATGKCAGGIRCQFASEANIRMSLLSLSMLTRFEEEHEQAIDLRRCGYLFMLTSPDEKDAFKRNLTLQHSLGVMTEWIDGDEVRHMLPLMQLDDVLAGTFHPDDGLADPNGVMIGYINSARRLGVRTLTDVTATGISVDSGQVRAVQTTQGTIACQVVVNASGPWAALVGRMAGLSLPISPVRRQWLTTTPTPEIKPDFPFVVDFARSLYFHLEGEGLLTGMSNSQQRPGFDTSVDQDWELAHMEAAAARLPLLERAGVIARVAGLYEVTPDAHPIIGRTPIEGFYVAVGFSGHGFMHAPATGMLMAEEILDGKTTAIDLGPLSLARFNTGDTPHEYNVI